MKTNVFDEKYRFGKTIGFTASTFDLLHAGHVAMLHEAKSQCDYLICGLQTDPTIDRPDTKNKPIQSIVERYIQLSGVSVVDLIVPYSTENDLLEILLAYPIDVRILGVEYQDKDFTGRSLCINKGIKICFNTRNHTFSTSSLRTRISDLKPKN